MLAAYFSDDPYVAFAVMAGAIPAGITGKNYKSGTDDYATQRGNAGAPIDYSLIRNKFKRCCLAVQYMMGAQGLAAALKTTEDVATDLLHQHHTTFRQFWHWQDQLLNVAIEFKEVVTRGGWRLDTRELNRRSASNKCTPRTIGNFPMQCVGAEVMRRATVYACRKGIPVIATLHDALMVEGREDEIDEIVRVTIEDCMDRASREVLSGHVLRTEANIYKYPQRYFDEDGVEMWETVKKYAGLED
jgi:DNA polymerase I